MDVTEEAKQQETETVKEDAGHEVSAAPSTSSPSSSSSSSAPTATPAPINAPNDALTSAPTPSPPKSAVVLPADSSSLTSTSTLRGEFLRGSVALARLEATTLTSASAGYQALVEEGIGALRKAAALAAAASVFSANEAADDIATGDLKYLLIDAYLGDLIARRTAAPPQGRADVVRAAEAHLRAFLHRLSAYGLLSAEDRAALDDAEKGVQRDANAQREYKIAKFKRQRAAQAHVAALTAQLTGNGRGGSGGGGGGKSIVDSADAALPLWARPGVGEEADDELDREYVLATLQAQALASLDALQLHQQELAILAHMEKVQRDAGSSSAAATAAADARRATPERSGPPLKPIVIKDTRAAVAARVFQPGWRQPTMTLDEFLELERLQGNVIQGGGPAQEAAMARAKAEREMNDSDADADEATYKAREWDEFTDVNPRGWGNRHNRS